MHPRKIDNPSNPYVSEFTEWLEDPPQARIEVYEETASSILSENDSPDLPFRWSVNPYRGCQHACAYCYARPYHEYLGYGAGTDFETKLVVKVNAPELLAAALRRRTWQRESINFSGITDCYQPLEACYQLTRRCLEVCLEFRNPAVVVTKSFLVVRDVDLLQRLARCASAKVCISIPFADDKTAKLIEPQAASPSRRFEAVRRLSGAGVSVSVLVSPIIPALNDSDIPEILERAAGAGARSASCIALRLAGSVEEVFVRRIREVLPRRADRIINRIREMRGGAMSDSRFGDRMRGQGAYWTSIQELFDLSARRYGLGAESPSLGGELDSTEQCRASPPGAKHEQLTLPFANQGSPRCAQDA